MNDIMKISGCFSFFGIGGLATTLAAIVLVAVILPVTKIYASELSQVPDSIDFVKKFIGSSCE